MHALLADALRINDSGGLIHSLLFILIVGICVLAIWWVGTWMIKALAAPAVVTTIWNGLFILIGLFVVINFLLGLLGHPLVQW